MSKKVVNNMVYAKTSLKQSGQALIELILAIAIATVLLGVLTTGIIAAREGFTRTEKHLGANLLIQKEIEALRSVRETAWNSISSPGTYHTEQSGNSWVAVPGTIVEGEFTRGFSVADVCRQDATSTTIDCGDPAAVLDPSTKEVTAAVSWSFLGTQSTSSTFYITRYFGNQTWVQTTQNDFKAGTRNNTKDSKRNGGAIELKPPKGGLKFTDDYLISGDYIFDPNKIEVAGDFARLKAQGPTVSGQTTDSGFDTGTNGWAFDIWRDDVSQNGSYKASGGNPGGYVDVNFPAQKNKKSGGYWYQPFTTTVNDPITTLTFDWIVTTYQEPLKKLRIYAFVDTTPGEPNKGDNIWDSGDITATSPWSATVTVDASSRVTTPGTYYLKVAVYVEYDKNNVGGPFTGGFDNVLLTWSGATGNYPTDSPTIHRQTSFSAPTITSWNSFTEKAITNGGSIRYQLSDDDGSTWKFFSSGSWVEATSPTDYNDTNTIDNNIGSFPTNNNKINVRAFLISDGTQSVKLDKITVGYTGTNTGTFVSSTFNAGSNVGFNTIFWTETNTPNTTISFQVATNNDSLTWDFKGPDGTANTFFTGGTGTLHLSSVSAHYLRYRIYFTSENNDVPFVEDVTVNYSP